MEDTDWDGAQKRDGPFTLMNGFSSDPSQSISWLQKCRHLSRRTSYNFPRSPFLSRSQTQFGSVSKGSTTRLSSVSIIVSGRPRKRDVFYCVFNPWGSIDLGPEETVIPSDQIYCKRKTKTLKYGNVLQVTTGPTLWIRFLVFCYLKFLFSVPIYVHFRSTINDLVIILLTNLNVYETRIKTYGRLRRSKSPPTYWVERLPGKFRRQQVFYVGTFENTSWLQRKFEFPSKRNWSKRNCIAWIHGVVNSPCGGVQTQYDSRK